MKNNTFKYLLLFMIVLIIILSLYFIPNKKDDEIKLESFTIPDGEILLKTNDTYSIPITYIPNNANIISINYYVDDNNIINVNNGVIKAVSPGSTLLKITVNNTFNKEIRVNVTNNNIE